MSRFHRVPILIVGVLASLVLCANAQAQITIGQLAPGSPVAFCSGLYDGAAIGPASGAYTVPTAGIITSWSTNAAAGAGQELNFKVYRPQGGGKYLVVGHDGPRALTPSAVDTFPTSIPVQAGDLIGNATSASAIFTACEFRTSNPEDESWFAEGDGADGATVEEESTREKEVRNNETATLLPPPTVTTISPASGSIKGGPSVVVSGTNLAEVKGVTFGAVPASSFTVESEGQITAVAPATPRVVKVPVTVTTVAGSASSGATFTYQGCVVPKLAGKKLKAAKKKLKKADCKIGKVVKEDGVTPNTGKVVGQSPKPGKTLAPSTKVKVILD